MTTGEHTGTADPADDIPASWWIWPMLPSVIVGGLVYQYAILLLGGAGPMVKLAALTAAIAVGVGVGSLCEAWQKRRHPERYAACKATLAAARERRRAKLRRLWRMSSARRAASERP